MSTNPVITLTWASVFETLLPVLLGIGVVIVISWIWMTDDWNDK